MNSGDGFLLVFSITSLSSLAELEDLREQIMNIKGRTKAHVPIVLVGNKCDLEEDRHVSRARAFGVSQDWGNVPYYETSARRRQNVDEVFKDLCRQILRRKEYGESDDEGESYARTHMDYAGNRHGHASGHRKSRRKKKKKREGPRCVIL